LNITVLANRDLASNFALNRLIPALAKEHRLHVFLSSHVGSNAMAPPELQQLKFFEQSLFSELLFPALENATGKAGLYSFDQLALIAGVPTFQILNKINSEQGLAALAASSPDLVLSIRYGGILRDEAIAIPQRGVLNLHSGLLPGYRGVMATFYAMMNGESKIGMTLHTICDAGIDTGDIIGCTRMDLDLRHSYLWNVLQLYPAGVDLMLASVATISAGESLSCQPQVGDGNYYSFPDEEQLAHFGEKGLRLYDVNETLEFAKQYLEL